MVNVISVADSKFGAPSTGHIYFYLTNLDFTANDLMKENKATLLYSADQDLSCSQQSIDSMEPTCSRIMISGKVKKASDTFKAMQYWKNHNYHFNVFHSS